jgi:hypothetical protein
MRQNFFVRKDRDANPLFVTYIKNIYTYIYHCYQSSISIRAQIIQKQVRDGTWTRFDVKPSPFLLLTLTASILTPESTFFLIF